MEDINILKKNFAKYKFNPYKETIIENDVWIGTKVIVLQGVTIGTGEIVGAGTVVTKDVAPYSIVGENPAREIRKRFSDETIEKLLASEWWNLSEEELKMKATDFLNVDEFLKNIK